MHCLILEIATVMKLGGGETALIKSNLFKDNNKALTADNFLKMNPCIKHIVVKYHFFKASLEKTVESHPSRSTLF